MTGARSAVGGVMFGQVKCRLGFHDWHVRALCHTRAVILLGLSNHGGEDRVCKRCGLEDNDMLNCSHGHKKIIDPFGVLYRSDDGDAAHWPERR